MPKAAKNDEIEQIIEDAKEGFDLRARLLGAPKLEKTIPVYTDAVTGKALGGDEEILDGPIYTGKRRRWGVIGRIADLEEQAEALIKDFEAAEASGIEGAGADVTAKIQPLEDELARLRKQSKTLTTKLDKSALVFTLKAVPDLIIRDSHRKARKAAGISGKGNTQATEDQNEAYTAERTALILSASLVQYVDTATGTVRKTISVEDAKALRDLLPVGQFKKLDRAMYDLSMAAAIGQNATDDADF